MKEVTTLHAGPSGRPLELTRLAAWKSIGLRLNKGHRGDNIAGFPAPHNQLTGVRAFRRVCCICCDPQECMEAAPIDSAGEGGLLTCYRMA